MKIINITDANKNHAAFHAVFWTQLNTAKDNHTPIANKNI